jgi:nitrite reductase/ring-hydroxylating ferredoxin subunit
MSVPAEWSTAAAELPPGTSATFTLRWRGRDVAAFVVNVDGQCHAYVNRCAHAGTPLDWWPNEFLSEDGRLLVCATHGALFEPATGRCVGGPCGGGALYPLAVRRDGARIVVTAGADAGDRT